MKIILLLSLILFNVLLFAQSMQSYEGNYLTFRSRAPKITEELKTMTPSEFHSHPEFGILPYNAPCENCYELIHKRTDTTKYYVENGTFGGKFYSQTLLGVFHYTENDVTKTYDGHLQPLTASIYSGKNQDTPTFIDIDSKTTGFIIHGERFSFNNNLSLSQVMLDGSEVSLGAANWSLYTVGEDGMRIIDAWPNIDITIDFALDRIKTNYIIKNPIGDLSLVKYLKFSDDILLPNGTLILEGSTEYFDEENHRYGDYMIVNNTNVEQFNIKPAFGYDASEIKEHSRNFFYELDNNNLSLFVPASNWLADVSTIYPVTIDPQVTSTATQTAGWMSFQYNGAWCGLAGSCNYNLTVARPANSTITGTTFTAQYQSLGGYCFFNCYRSEAAFKIVSPCGASPAPAATFWNCAATSAGTCSAANVNVFPELGACLGAACSGNVTFQIQNSYCYCATGGNCGNNCQWMPNNTWSMTLIGTTLETLGNTATGNGTQTITPPSCSGTNVTLNPTPTNGVPGFTYSWTNGASSPTLTIPGWTVYSAGTYTCIVTDACGVTRTATFIVACPLGVEYNYFIAERANNRDISIQWSTIQESSNDYFELERSVDGISFTKIGTIPSKGTGDFEYEYLDLGVNSDVNYYRLANFNTNGEVEYTAPIRVDVTSDKTMEIVPNPSNGSFFIQFDVAYDQHYELEITDELGKIVLQKPLDLTKGSANIPVNLEEKSRSIYFVNLISKNKSHKQRIVIQ